MTLSLDLETHPIDRALLAPPIVCVGLCDDDDAPRVLLWRDVTPAMAERWLSGPIIGANIAFDMCCIMAAEPDLVPLVFDAYRGGRIRDVLLDAKMIDIARGLVDDGSRESYSLGAVAERAGRPMAKDSTWRLEYARLANVPLRLWPREAVEYIHEDVVEPLRLHAEHCNTDDQWQLDRGGPLLLHSASEAYHSLSFRLMSAWGVRTDGRKVAKLAEATQDRITAHRTRLQAVGLVRGETKLDRKGRTVPNREAGKRDTKAATALMQASWPAGLERKLTPAGKLSLDSDACTLSGNADLIAYSEYGSAGTLYTRIEDLAAGADLPLQAGFDTMLETYRTSSFKPRAPVRGIQMQNFGRADGTRETLTPRPGCCFLIADLEAMEMCTMAELLLHMFGRSKLAELLNSGVDPHWWFARLRDPSLPERYDSSDPESKIRRDQSKPSNFGWLGGMREEKFVLFSRDQYGQHFTIEQAAEYRRLWFTAIPEGEAYLDSIKRTVGRAERGTLRHPITGCWRTARYCALANFGFQHLGAIGVKKALAELSYRMYSVKSSALYGCRLWNAVHDEAIGECPLEQAHDAAEELGRVFTEVFNNCATPNVPSHAECIVSTVWSKQAKAAWSNGKRVPWAAPEP